MPRPAAPDRTLAPPRGGRLVVGLAVVAILVQLYGLYRPVGPPTPSWFPQADKLEHATGFALPTMLVLLALALRRPGVSLARRPQLLVTGVFVAHAVVSEVIQHFFYRHRTGDPLDALADSVGVALGWLLFRAVVRAWSSRAGAAR